MILLRVICLAITAGSLCYCQPDVEEIVNGEDAKQDEFPFLIELRYRFFGWYQICGGSQLTPSTVLTAAHCVEDDLTGDYRIVAGQYSLNKDEGTEQMRPVTSILVHPDYNTRTVENDVALLYLKKPVNMSLPNVALVPRLSTPKLDAQALTSDKAVAMGWGYVNDNTLQKLKTRFISNRRCDRKLAKFGLHVTPEMICSYNKEAGTCSGDSGSPVGFYRNRNFIQVGITSWGPAVACRNGRQVMTRVSSFKSWIEDNLTPPV